MTFPRLILSLLLALFLAVPLGAQSPAHLQIGASSLLAEGRGHGKPRPMELTLVLDRPVPYRTFLVGDPARLIVDLKDADLAGLSPQDLFGHDLVPAIRWGAFGQGWSRIVLELGGPYRIARAGLRATAPEPVLRVALEPVSAQDFAPRPSATTALRDLPLPADLPRMQRDEGLIVVLDPGHGGFDPGALANGASEANLVLVFALELRAALKNRGIGVVMTRERDSFVSLEQRMTLARSAQADLLISLHADALPSGQATGASVYVWSERANDRAAAQLALRHDRDDLLAGVDLAGQDDTLAGVMMDFARTDTQPRSENFARFLVSRIALMGIGLHGRPVQGAAFSVLKAPDIPSVLLELGFISDPEDRANLSDPAWRERMVRALAESIEGWARDEEARKAVLRR